MDRSWINTRLFGKAHLDGVSEFMMFVSERFDDNVEIRCPCRKCLNQVHLDKGQVEDHLYIHGMASTYTRWIHHGEPLEGIITENESHSDEQLGFSDDVGMNQDVEDDPNDGIPEMVKELFDHEDEASARKSKFAILFEEMKQELYPGAAYTRFSFVVKLLHIKSFYRISNIAFNAMLKLISSAFPNCSIPTSFQEAKKLIRALGLGYDSIHVCPNNCVLFRKDHAKLDECPVCGASRWKDTNGRKQIPKKATNDTAKGIAKGTRSSKRVMAPEQPEQTTRVTRQKTAANLCIMDSTHDSLAPTTPMDNEEQANNPNEGAITDMIQVPRGLSKGLQLDSMTRGLGEKISIHIAEGKKRPEPPMQAAKFASEGGIAIRQHVPIFTHWKFYKDKKNKVHVKNYLGKLSTQFNIDTSNEAVENACLDMLKSGQRQMRYRLKKKYFNGVPASEVITKSPVKCMTDDQWRALVESWSTSQHKKQEKYKDTELTAIDLFKVTHCSRKNGYSEPVKKAIAAMEAIVSESGQEGQQPKSPTEVVSQVLPKSSTFLQNVGITFANKSRIGGASALQMQQLQAQLDAEKQESAGLKDQLDTIKIQAQESDAKLAEQTLEIDSLKKKQEETNALLRQLLSFSHGQSNHPTNI